MKNAETPVFKLILFGSEGSLGSALIVESLSRQHEVTVIVDDLNRYAPRPGLHTKIGGLDNADQAEQSVAGGSAVVALLSTLAPDDACAQQAMVQALITGLSRTTIRRLLLVGDFDVLDEPSRHSPEKRICVDGIVDLLRRGGLRWTLINAPEEPSGLGIEHFRHIQGTLEPGLAEPLHRLARIAAGIVDTLDLGLHEGEHLNFVG
ncbi:NAD(P)H-binding protein [Pseudomonas capeferrum]|uniref:NAD(P)-dependent oxidoreductase n=1 Tax=Pseudomonas capeferrum TaxID=1495066 RepID=UPI0015E2EAF8|nr:NAD(P)H-binding protein [Pseudomonas capeferrum]MBA1203879.1 NAD(P)H-binding protein [Pseudomonas capeferrum]